MGYVVRMPQLGMTMEEGVVVEWRYDEGEEFSEGDVIGVVESEKTTNDVEAREDGVFLEKFVDLEEGVGPGDPVAYVGEPGEEVPEDVREEAAAMGEDGASGGAEVDEGTGTAAGAEGAASADASSAGGAGGSAAVEAKVSPRARAYARDNDLPQDGLDSLDGSGPDGAVIERDVIEAAESGAFAETPAAGPGASVSGGDTAGSVDVDGRGIYEQREGSRLRQAVAERMTASAREAPQVTLNRRVPVDDLLALKDGLAEDRGLDLSLSDFLVAALVEAIEEYPEFNGVYEDGVHKLAGNVNVGFAIDVDDGLLTPVIKGADRRSLTGIAEERSRLVEATLSGEHTHDDLSDGTITITNLGHFDVETFDPIINPPQIAILGVGAIREEYDPEADEAVSKLSLSLTFDHRAVDGADTARFLDAIADALLHPLRLLTLGGTDGQAAGTAEQSEGGEGGASTGDQRGTFRELDSPATEERAAQVHSEAGMHATVRSRQFEWDVDEPADVGGEDTAPNPVEQFLGSLGSCLSLTFRNMAERRDVPVDSVEVEVEASPEDGLIQEIEVSVTVVSEADESDLERVLQTAERACYVNQAIDDEIERSMSLTVQSP